MAFHHAFMVVEDTAMVMVTDITEILGLAIMVIISQDLGIIKTIAIGIIITIEIEAIIIETIIAIKTIVNRRAKDHILTIEKRGKAEEMVEGLGKPLFIKVNALLYWKGAGRCA